jgi:nucleoid DNA-binding protein
MTDKEMEREISKRTGLPSNAVRLFLDTQNDVIREALTRQEDVAFKSLLRIRSTYTARSLRDRTSGAHKKVRMLMLSIRPMRAFRTELNRWTNTQ